MTTWTAAAIGLLALGLAACASAPAPAPAPGAPGGQAVSAVGEDPLKNSAECEAARLKPPAPLPVSAISDEVLRQRQSGWTTVRYDVVNGQPQNLRVVSSSPAGLYDPFALRHARAYSDPGGGSARGCIMTVNIRF